MEKTDRMDWQRFCRGEKAALERIYQRHKDRLFTYCCYLTADRQLSEDVVQETFLKLTAHAGKLDGQAHIGNWLFVCTRNLVYNELQKRRTRGSLLRSVNNPSSSVDVGTRLFIERVLDKLAVEDRELILLREHQRYSTAEIAGMLRISEAAVRVRLYRVRKKMQQIAEGKMNEKS